jgi:large subunit ribosomal protein L4
MADKNMKTAAPKKASAPKAAAAPKKAAAPKAAAPSLKLKVRNVKAETVGEATLPEEIFGVPFKRHLVWEVVKEIRAREHRGTHKTKTRSEVSGSGKKPFKQKSTGRARQGGGRPPIHRHGGTVFGPVPHSYALKLATHKTQDFAGVLAKLGVEGKTLVVDRKDNENLARAVANNPKVTTLDPLGLNVYDALNAGTIVLTEDALRAVSEVLA